MSASLALAVWPRRTGLLLAVAALGLLVVLVLVGGRPGSAAAAGPIDASGTWDFQMQGYFSFKCDNAGVMQSGTSISFQMVCETSSCPPLNVCGPATFSLSGMIDTATGAFTADQAVPIQFTMAGTVNKSGDGMSGSWAVLLSSLIVKGTFTGSRQPSSPPPTPPPSSKQSTHTTIY